MKNKRNILLLILLLSTVLVLDTYSQELNDENTNLINSYFSTDSETVLLNETTDLTVQMLDADIVINQIGNDNEAVIQANTSTEAKVNQVGDNNDFELLTYYNSNQIDITSSQVGDNNSVQVYGANEISNGMEIKQTTNNQSLIIINY